MSNVTSDQVKKMARLASLPLDKDEEQTFADQLSKILDYVEVLEKVNTAGINPTFNVTGTSSVIRQDQVEQSLPQDEVLINTSSKKDGFFVTKGVFK